MVVPCSGRYLKSIPQNLLMMGNVRYAVTANGAQIWSMRSLSSLYRLKASGRNGENRIGIPERTGRVCGIVFPGKSYINEGDSIRASRINHNYNFVRYFTRNHILVPDLSKAADLWNETEKINLFFWRRRTGSAWKES